MINIRLVANFNKLIWLIELDLFLGMSSVVA